MLRDTKKSGYQLFSSNQVFWLWKYVCSCEMGGAGITAYTISPCTSLAPKKLLIKSLVSQVFYLFQSPGFINTLLVVSDLQCLQTHGCRVNLPSWIMFYYPTDAWNKILPPTQELFSVWIPGHRRLNRRTNKKLKPPPSSFPFFSLSFLHPHLHSSPLLSKLICFAFESHCYLT